MKFRIVLVLNASCPQVSTAVHFISQIPTYCNLHNLILHTHPSIAFLHPKWILNTYIFLEELRAFSLQATQVCSLTLQFSGRNNCAEAYQLSSKIFNIHAQIRRAPDLKTSVRGINNLFVVGGSVTGRGDVVERRCDVAHLSQRWLPSENR